MKENAIAMGGAGLSCAVIARQLADRGYQIEIYEARHHIAGNCHTARDVETDVMVHEYGPHIFHTDDREVWDYVNQFASFMPFTNRVKAQVKGRVYTLPVNLLTINQFFGACYSPTEALEHIQSICDQSITEPRNFEEQALKMIGRDLYEGFFRGYTLKQWGIDPVNLPASILKRLPLRFNYDDNYFSHKYQGIPSEGYTEMVSRIVDHPNITVYLNTPLDKESLRHYSHTFFSGPIDAFYNHSEGLLPYRTLDFERFSYQGDFQGCAVMNYCDVDVPFTRITEHKHFAPWENHSGSVCYRERSRACELGDEPFYPINLVGENEILSAYKRLAANDKQITFVGRLGTFKYMDMDVTIRQALDVATQFLRTQGG